MTFDHPVPTHNPWHPAYKLTPEGREKVMRELAPERLAALVRLHSGETITVSFGGAPYAGFVKP